MILNNRTVKKYITDDITLSASAPVWLDRPRQDRQGGHRYPVRLCLAVRGQWFDHAQAPPAGARGVAGAGCAGLDGNRVRGGQVRHHPAQGGRLTPCLTVTPLPLRTVRLLPAQDAVPRRHGRRERQRQVYRNRASIERQVRRGREIP